MCLRHRWEPSVLLCGVSSSAYVAVCGCPSRSDNVCSLMATPSPVFPCTPMVPLLQCMTPFPTTLPSTGLPGDFNTGEGNPGSLDHASGAAAISVTGVVVAAAVAAGAAAVGLP